jgi:hypothetical protein
MGPGGMPAGFVPGPEMRMGGMGGMGAMSGPGSPFGGPGGAPVRLSPGPSMPPAGVPMKPAAGPPVVQQRKSSAIRIVNPNSKEEVKGDFKKPDPEKKTPGEEGAEKEGDKKPAAAPAPAPRPARRRRCGGGGRAAGARRVPRHGAARAGLLSVRRASARDDGRGGHLPRRAERRVPLGIHGRVPGR